MQSVQYISAPAVNSHLNVYCTLKSRTLPKSLQVGTGVWAGLNRCSTDAVQWCTNSRRRVDGWSGGLEWRWCIWSLVVQSEASWLLFCHILHQTVKTRLHVGFTLVATAEQKPFHRCWWNIRIMFTSSSGHKLEHSHILRQQMVVSMNRQTIYNM